MTDSASTDRSGTGLLAGWPRPGFTPDAVVFDCDGLLVDTEAEWVRVQTEYLAAHGVELDPAVRRELTGRSAETVVQAIADAVGKNPQDVVADIVARYREDLEEGLRILPGAVEIVRICAQRLPVAVASNSPSDMLDRKLRILGVDGVISARVAIEDVERPKPAPDLYLRAAEMLGVDSARTLALEDSETGASAARSAGMALITIPSLPGQDPQGDLRLASLEDADLLAWVESWPIR